MRDRAAKGRGKDQVGESNTNVKLTEGKVRMIRAMWSSGVYTQMEIGGIFDVTYANISEIARRKIWRHVKEMGNG